MTTMQREFSDDAHTYISAAAAATEDYAGGGCLKGYFMPTYAIYEYSPRRPSQGP